MKFLLLIVLLSLNSLVNEAQEYRRSNNWAIGNDPVVKFNFSNGLSINVANNISTIPYCIIKSSSSSISDTNGKMLFLSNGFFLYDSSGYSMDNGMFVNCPFGNILANYYGASLFDQTSIILPKKGNTYYVFSTGMSDSVANNYLNHTWTEFDVLNYSVVDMDSNAGKGKVVQKNVVLADNQHYNNCAMQAVKHTNGKDWWLVKADCWNNRYQEFLVKEDTIMGPYYQNVSTIGDWCVSYSELYFSNDGNILASSIYGKFEGGLNSRNRVDLYDFDRCNGNIEFKKYYMTPYDTSSYPNNDFKNGICFSPNDSLLYMSNLYTIYQIDLYDTNTYNAIFIHGPDTTIANFPWYHGIAVAPDGKMYIGNDNGTRKYMSYIDKPNVKGLGCDFVPQGVWQPYTNLMSPPNMPNYGLGEDTSVVCWPLSISPSPSKGGELLEVYPNPAYSKLYIKYEIASRQGGQAQSLANTTKQLYNSIGQLMLSTKENEIDVSGLSKGVYYLRVENQVVKVIVE
jgi:hypothetical protein